MMMYFQSVNNITADKKQLILLRGGGGANFALIQALK